MQLRQFTSLEVLYEQAAHFFIKRQQQGARVFGLATGGTMEPLYAALRTSDIDFSACTSFNLDEYVSVQAQQSYATYMEHHLLHAKPFLQSYIPNGAAYDVEAEAARYDELLAKHDIDVQLLGVGENGHIGFNEPHTPFSSRTHVVALTPSTRQANARFFQSLVDVPTQAITVGIAPSMAAREIIVIATGEKKRAEQQQLLHGDVTEDVPITALQQHPHVYIFTDLQL